MPVPQIEYCFCNVRQVNRISNYDRFIPFEEHHGPHEFLFSRMGRTEHGTTTAIFTCIYCLEEKTKFVV